MRYEMVGERTEQTPVLSNCESDGRRNGTFLGVKVPFVVIFTATKRYVF